jgi:hypothetical protein
MATLVSPAGRRGNPRSARPLVPTGHYLNRDLLGWWLGQPSIHGLTWFSLPCGDLYDWTLSAADPGWTPSLRPGSTGVEYLFNQNVCTLSGPRDSTIGGLDFGSPSGLTVPDSATICFWLRPDATPDSFANLFAADAGNGVYLLSDGTVELYPFTASTGTPTNGVYTHVTIVFDAVANTVSYYFNGVLDSSPDPGGTVLGFVATNMGSDSFAEGFTGVLDDLRVFARVLSDAEVRFVYEQALTGNPDLLSFYGDSPDVAFTLGNPTNTRGTTLYIKGTPPTGGVPLYIENDQSLTEVHSSTTLFLYGDAWQSGSTPLFTWGDQDDAANIPLFIGGDQPVAAGTPLFTHGDQDLTTGVSLMVQAEPRPTATGSLALSLYGQTGPGMTGGVPLVTYADANANKPGVAMTLFVAAPVSQRVVSGMNLSMSGRHSRDAAATPLFVANTRLAVVSSATLLVDGTGQLDGGTPREGNLNLFLQRRPAGMATLYIAGPGTPQAAGTTLVLPAQAHQTSQTTLVMPATRAPRGGAAKLYIHGF